MGLERLKTSLIKLGKFGRDKEEKIRDYDELSLAKGLNRPL